MSVALAATLHDATGALAGEIRRRLPAMRRLYPAGIAISTSPPTSARVVSSLGAAGVHAGSPRTNTRGPLYRLALRRALATEAERVHYLDFDRALHWLAVAPGEYAAVLRTAAARRALLVGRTEKAHRSHHRPLYATETIANGLMADRLGWRGRIDFLVPSFVMDRAHTAALLRASAARQNSMYGEWAALVAATTGLVYVECRGLEWETPDRHRREVARIGIDAWRDHFDTAEEWKARSDMATAIVAGFETALAKLPAARHRSPTRLRPRAAASPR